jgi:hypothetical protein
MFNKGAHLLVKNILNDGQVTLVDMDGHRPERVLKLRISISVSGTTTDATSERA